MNTMNGMLGMNNMNAMQLAQIYIADQPYGELYCIADALKNGTIFQNLNMPYILTYK